VPTKI